MSVDQHSGKKEEPSDRPEMEIKDAPHMFLKGSFFSEEEKKERKKYPLVRCLTLVEKKSRGENVLPYRECDGLVVRMRPF